MSDRVRFMRLVVFFDLPMTNASERKAYARFRKFLLKDGYLMLQNSVYAKMVTSSASAGGAVQRITKNRPSEGVVQMLQVTEKQFASMTFITGERKEHEEVDTMERLVVL